MPDSRHITTPSLLYLQNSNDSTSMVIRHPNPKVLSCPCHLCSIPSKVSLFPSYYSWKVNSAKDRQHHRIYPQKSYSELSHSNFQVPMRIPSLLFVLWSKQTDDVNKDFFLRALQRTSGLRPFLLLFASWPNLARHSGDSDRPSERLRPGNDWFSSTCKAQRPVF